MFGNLATSLFITITNMLFDILKTDYKVVKASYIIKTETPVEKSLVHAINEKKITSSVIYVKILHHGTSVTMFYYYHQI